jgi:hypothetical protein
MNIKHDQFIGIYEDAYSLEFCHRVINYFENIAKAGFSTSRQVNENTPRHDKEDLTVFPFNEKVICLESSADLLAEVNRVFWKECYPDYAGTYSVLTHAEKHSIYGMRVQKTEPGQGYHLWHFESDNRACANRLMAWTIYLNDVEEGGETEFLYIKKRIKPKAGTLIIWPAGYTHTHRGNPPLSNPKYIITGWIEY